MKLPPELLLLSLIPPALSLPLTPRSATFPQLAGLTPLPRDRSTTDKRFPDKYFHEATFHPHYDGRFAASALPPETRAFHLRLLLRAYMTAMRRAGVRTWLMHGSLLGWWWNGGMFPWESDVDVCVGEEGMGELAGWWNMTIHTFTAQELGVRDPEPWGHPYEEPIFPWTHTGREDSQTEDQGKHEYGDAPITPPANLPAAVLSTVLEAGKRYLLEINPHHTTTSTSDTHNVIDARFIDTATGLFIDITTLHAVPPSTDSKSEAKHRIYLAANPDQPNPAAPTELYTKDTHLYTTTALFPLRRTAFEGTTVHVPYAYETLLVDEYGPRALTETWFNGYAFERSEGEWRVGTEKDKDSRTPGEGSGRGDREDVRKAGGRVRGGAKRPKWKPVRPEVEDRGGGKVESAGSIAQSTGQRG